MNESELDKMEAGARAANKGDWYGPKSGKIIIIKQDAIHIANCSPPAIISMINEIRKLRKELAKKDTELFHAERATGCQAHEMGSISPCTCRREMGG